MPIVTTKKMIQTEERRLQQEHEAQKIEEIKAKLAAEYGIPRDKKFDRCWEIAWSHGHSAGYYEVVSLFREFVQLILND